MFKNLINVSSGYIFRYLFQIVSFWIIAHQFGANLFGQFSAAICIASILSSISGWGGYPLIVRDVSNNKDPQTSYTSTLVITSALTVILVIIGLLINYIWFKEINAFPFFLLLISEIFFTSTLVNASSVFISQSFFNYSSFIQILSGIVRCVAAIILYTFPIYNALDDNLLVYWSFLLLLSNFIVFLVCNYIISKKFGKFNVDFNNIKEHIKNGRWFSLMTLTESLYANLDKVILVSLIGYSELGKYSSAFRFVFIAYLPLNSILTIAYRKFFDLAKKNKLECRRYAFQIQKYTILYALFAISSLIIFSFFIEFFLGENYEGTNLILRYMSIVLIFQAIYTPFNDYLISLKKEGLVTVLKFISIIITIILNFILTKFYGTNGAIFSYIIGQSFLCVFMFYTPNMKRDSLKNELSEIK
ncbi:oligosaccharide flippase family protein [Fluviispira multicolorata]|uniref:Oligosaccharide flippase family protein n=1 Tax=Fluviispira multicolorata TaxID=2654512 RepID=A0A833JF85_9BACT|nr:oligosaccharide flippase family protein [Fluviispira multicolorata]KAB8030854.1 oligosaccharide flippase family protein [Fluviispira multicolorata]